MKHILLISTTIFFLSSCAGTFNNIAPQTVNYRAEASLEDVDFSYKYDVLNDRGNKRYAKKESKHAIKLVSVKISNYSDRSLVFGKDLRIYANGEPVTPLEPQAVYKNLKQNPPIYLLYLLLTFSWLNINGGDDIPIGLVLGPGLALGNMGVAAGANKKFMFELEANSLINKEIGPGKTVYGLVGIVDSGYSPLTLEFAK